MEKFRRDIHGVFARQQSGLGSATGASDRLLRQALAQADVRQRFIPQLAAAIATLLVGAAIAYTVVVTRGHLHSQNPVTRVSPTARPTPSATATPNPSPTALSQALAVPATTPVILYFDPVNRGQVDGVTWDGSQRGRVGTVSGASTSLGSNPAGTLYMTWPDIRNRSGQVVGQVAGHAKISTLWTDDGCHYCQLISASALPPASGEPAILRVVAIDGTLRNVSQVGTMYEQSGAGVVACSLERDRAVVTQSTSIGATLKVWAVQVSTGRIIWTKSFGTNAPANAIPSRDGQYVAISGPIGTPTTIYGPSGEVVATLRENVQGFSWDGTLAVVGQYGGVTSITRWRDGKVIWTAPRGIVFMATLPEPRGSAIAVEDQTPVQPTVGGGSPRVDVYAVSPDGTAIKILSNVSL